MDDFLTVTLKSYSGFKTLVFILKLEFAWVLFLTKIVCFKWGKGDFLK